MSSISIINGYIMERGGRFTNKFAAINARAIAEFPYDEKYPFTNIFWCDSPAIFERPIIGLAGSFEQIEKHWNEWLWKFSQLLSHMEALEARVDLHCERGSFFWRLQPRAVYLDETALLDSFIGQRWGIVEASGDDFLLNPQPGDNEKSVWNNETNNADLIVWENFVERWDEKS